MISYTITVQQTRGTTQRSYTETFADVFDIYGDYTNPIYDDIIERPPGPSANGQTVEEFWASDGGYSKSSKVTASASNDSRAEFAGSGSFSQSEEKTENSDGAVTQTYASGTTAFFQDGTYEENTQDGTNTVNYTTPTFESIEVYTSATLAESAYISTTQTYNEVYITGATSISGTGSETTKYATIQNTFVESTGLIVKQLPYTRTLTTTVESEGLPDAPRDTATVFHFYGTDNACVWVPTRAKLDSLGPWALTDIAESHTEDFTALPLYCAAKPLVIVDQSVSEEIPYEQDGNNRPNFTYTTITLVPNDQVSTIYEKHSISGFPLQPMLLNFVSKFTTTAITQSYNTFTANLANLTEEWTEIFSTSAKSVEIIDSNLSYQEFPAFTFSTTRYKQFSYTSSESQSPTQLSDSNGQAYDNYTYQAAKGLTIEGNYIEHIYIRAFNPVKISHRETSFTYAWGLHASPAPEPKLAIETPAHLRWSSWAELLPDVEAPYPTSSSWESGASSITASIAGNFITLTTQSGTDSNSASGSETYQFSGSGTAYTTQQVGRTFFTQLGALPDISFFGPHPATEEIETRARAGTYVSIVQDSLGDFTLNTITLAESSASIISANAILYPAENSFYLTTAAGFYAGGGQPFTVTPRNPIP